MDWLQNYHEDHKDVLVLLAKLTGSIMDLKAGMETPNTFIEFKEFADVIKNVLQPHFRSEESGVYKKTAEYGPKESSFIDDMLREHQALYALFDQYLEAVEKTDRQKLIEIGSTLERVLTDHITKEEDTLPRLFKLRID